MSDFVAVFERLAQYIPQRMQRSQTPGVALALFDRERCVHVAAWGSADLERQIPLTPDHLFPIGSITKSFTALAVVQAAEQGLLDFHDPVTSYLDWFQVQS
ncbi:MAG: beta-lactamase family protein, partial [Anaerolineae bacterium]|nr:beta-lactamase family protein [Anaerolineae bacterium]